MYFFKSPGVLSGGIMVPVRAKMERKKVGLKKIRKKSEIFFPKGCNRQGVKRLMFTYIYQSKNGF